MELDEKRLSVKCEGFFTVRLFFAWHSGFISLMSGPWHAMMIHRRVTEGDWLEISFMSLF